MGQVTVVGSGAWGTALANLLARQGEQVFLWAWQAAHATAMARDRENREFFPGNPLHDSVTPVSGTQDGFQGSDLIVLVVPSHAMRATLTDLRDCIPGDAALVSATKGIENDSLMLMSEVVEEVLGPEVQPRCAFLSGPSFAKEVERLMPTNVVVAGADEALVQQVQRRFATERFRVYASDDPVGVEVGGATKNVIAIAAGACDGLGFGHNTRAALITRGLVEISRIAVAKGGSPRTLGGLAGMGDLVLTCTGDLSRNRTVGLQMGQGRTLDEVLVALGHVAEGVRTARSTYHLAQRLGVELPICNEVYRVLYENKPPLQAVQDVLTRPLKKEFD